MRESPRLKLYVWEEAAAMAYSVFEAREIIRKKLKKHGRLDLLSLRNRPRVFSAPNGCFIHGWELT